MTVIKYDTYFGTKKRSVFGHLFRNGGSIILTITMLRFYLHITVVVVLEQF